jgi:hypothetical protein
MLYSPFCTNTTVALSMTVTLVDRGQRRRASGSYSDTILFTIVRVHTIGNNCNCKEKELRHICHGSPRLGLLCPLMRRRRQRNRSTACLSSGAWSSGRLQLVHSEDLLDLPFSDAPKDEEGKISNRNELGIDWGHDYRRRRFRGGSISI